MQSGGGAQQGGGGHGWNTVAGPPSSAASPSSSSPAVYRQHLGFDPMEHQQQQLQMQSLQQQLLRNPESREAISAYQAGIKQGVLEGGFDQHLMNSMQQAYMMQYAQQGQSQSQSQNQKQYAPQPQQGIHNMGNSQVAMAAQMQAMQALARERTIGQQKVNMGQQSNQQVNSANFANASSPHSDMSGHSGATKTRQVMSPGQLGATQNATLVNNSTGGQSQHLAFRQPTVSGSGMSSMPPPQSPANMSRGADHFSKHMITGTDSVQIQHARQQMNTSSSQFAASSNNVGSDNPSTSQKVQKLPPGFTKQQFHVLKAQILAFRRIKKGDKTLPRELLRAIAPPPLEVQLQQIITPACRNLMDSNNKDLQEVYEVKKMEGTTANAQGTTVINEPLLVRGKQEHEGPTDKGKDVASTSAVVSQSVNSSQTKDPELSRKYHGPLFDFPFFTRKHDSFGSTMMVNNNSNLTLAYDVKDFLVDEGINKKKNESLKKINGLLAVNLERKRITPDLVTRLQIEEKKLKLQDVQTRVRGEVNQQQQEIMEMPDRPYRKFVRLCERQRMDLNRKVQAAKRAVREKQLKVIFQWRKKLLEAHWGIRDARSLCNRGVAKYHEKMLREFVKNKDDDRSKRIEALKNNDVDRYKEILLEQQNSVPGEVDERYEVLSSFLSQTEDYLSKLGGKITAAKNQQEVEEAANAAFAAARSQGLSEEEVRAAASRAREEVLIRNRFSEMNAPRDSSSVSKYYSLAHAVSERVIQQPSMLKRGTLRDYQLVGLQWMLSLYNNKLNGILADEMGLGKTVQVMALIAYLMEFKNNYGPHLIIVPNAVLVNWKSELHNWLPNVSCIYYVGNKDQRSKLFTQEVSNMKFNVLVTTYEFIMFDKSKLSRVDWKYIVIDEAQRMKDRESVLARDLDKYRCQRRLLLTGTPLQNDLKELWSLLNLLLPDVFDNKKVFHDWFSQPFQKEGTHNAEDDWLETEKKVIIIHRLHQILEPFMLRRRVEDVEGSLPPKISIILRCKMSAIQSVIYDWIKATGTIRVDPEDENRKVQKSSIYQPRTFKPLNNKIVELRKTCNHPLLNYPFFNDLSKEFLVKSCGKLWVLDRILIKLQKTGHRVLLFSTMTKLLDILEEYLQWRRLVYRRIDGTTSLEDRESAIVDFNSPDTDCFIFLLSIRAAGRGLNLQTADTVIIYDPDPNPKNEEQAVARAHRIGQTREVKVIYMEAVVDKVVSYQKEDNDDLAGKDRYMGSIESLIRNNIQQYKIDMADEVINAGRFDQRTTHEERRSTLESLLRDEERYQETVHDVPSLQEVNRMIARSEEEVEIFDQMDEEFDWMDEMTRYDQVPKWLRASTREVNATVAKMSKKPSKDTLFGNNVGLESSETRSGDDVKRRARLKGKKFLNYAELDDDMEEFFEAISEEIVNADDDYDDDGNASIVKKGKSKKDDYHMFQEQGSSGSSLDSKQVTPIAIPFNSSKKFGSLSALDARSGSRFRRMSDDLEEGETAISGDSNLQQSGSLNLNHDRDEHENDKLLQPKLKRKRSIRVRPRPVVRTQDNKSVDRSSLLHGQTSQPPFQANHGLNAQTLAYRKVQAELKLAQQNNAYKYEQSNRSMKAKWTPPARKNLGQPTRASSISGTSENDKDWFKERLDGKVKKGSAPFGGTAMPDAIQRKCKNVITKIQRRIDKEGQQIIPLLTDLWKKIESHRGNGVNSLLNLRKIELRVDRLEYFGVTDLIADVQLMLKSGMQYFDFSHEVRTEARKAHDLFFDTMKIAFPNTDFRDARSALTFSSSLASFPKRLPPVTRPNQMNDPEPEPSLTPRPFSRGSIPVKETRFGKAAGPTHGQEPPRRLSHPGELVICKKKRKEREKSTVVRSPGQSQTFGQQGNGIGVSFGWANPVKKMRTDIGKRRPIQL